MTAKDVYLQVTTSQGLRDEHLALIPWRALLMRSSAGSDEGIATARGISSNFGIDYLDYDGLEEISDEYGRMAFHVHESGILYSDYQNPLFISDLVVAPQWRGHNIGPHMLRWMATAIGNIGSIFLVPNPLGTRLDTDGEWVTDYELPRAGSGGLRKVRSAYRRGGFTHLRHGTWWTFIGDHEAEMKRVQKVMKHLER